jgi:hypothetical protein
MGVKRLVNADLKKDDKVQLISMTDPYKIPSGMMGIVTSVSEVQGSKIFGVRWETPDGKHVGSLSLIDDINPETGKRFDNWFKIVEEEDEELNERFITLTKGQILRESKKKLLKNSQGFQNYMI